MLMIMFFLLTKLMLNVVDICDCLIFMVTLYCWCCNLSVVTFSHQLWWKHNHNVLTWSIFGWGGAEGWYRIKCWLSIVGSTCFSIRFSSPTESRRTLASFEWSCISFGESTLFSSVFPPSSMSFFLYQKQILVWRSLSRERFAQNMAKHHQKPASSLETNFLLYFTPATQCSFPCFVIWVDIAAWWRI